MFLFNRNIIFVTDPLAEYLYLPPRKRKNNEHTLPKHNECPARNTKNSFARKFCPE
jgi:hypothetical protein